MHSQVRVNKHDSMLTTTLVSTIYTLGGYFAGGYALYLGLEAAHPYGDIDIFCKDEEAYDELEMLFRRLGRVVTHESSEALTFDGKLSVIKPRVDSLGRARFGMPNDVIAQFDITGIMAYYDEKSNQVIWQGWEHYTDAVARMVRLNPAQARPVLETWVRTLKYVRKGWSMHISVMNYLATNWADPSFYTANLTDVDFSGLDSG